MRITITNTGNKKWEIEKIISELSRGSHELHIISDDYFEKRRQSAIRIWKNKGEDNPPQVIINDINRVGEKVGHCKEVEIILNSENKLDGTISEKGGLDLKGNVSIHDVNLKCFLKYLESLSCGGHPVVSASGYIKVMFKGRGTWDVEDILCKICAKIDDPRILSEDYFSYRKQRTIEIGNNYLEIGNHIDKPILDSNFPEFVKYFLDIDDIVDTPKKYMDTHLEDKTNPKYYPDFFLKCNKM